MITLRLSSRTVFAASSAALLIIGASCGSSEAGEDEGVALTQAIPEPRPVVASASRVADGVIVARRGGLTRFAAFSPGESGVDFMTTEVNGTDAYQWQHSMTTSFAIQHIAARHPDEVFVGGSDPQSGEVVIERWTFVAPSGALAGSLPATVHAIGTSSPLHWPTVSIAGGAFLPPDDRGPMQPPTRQTVYRGAGIPGLARLVVDPEGRFLLLQDAVAGEIWQLIPGVSLTRIVDVASVPNVGHAVLCPPFQDGFNDRVYAFMMRDSLNYLVLHDPENDGVFSTPQIISPAALELSFPLGPVGPYKIYR